ncbi:cap-specific mRNA (nucleoside-2'-O-)-methyltransferase 1 [Eupeodes corollae]|uniref:cap-specific mRNA (nucleoside-2'-O-)-methyltransferase 1 n=1 Tax=Eupeodes corollae TaxID=290404 RepID=UPI00249293EB|nr:cap-specific mRNA (nucleoside-2'-O-)-methyltransferase 1 [Eupeodes corollae]
MSSSSDDDSDGSESTGSEQFEAVPDEESAPDEPQPKKVKTGWSNSYSSTVQKMMTNMGYKKDQGLGKLGQGRLEPVEAARQDGRRGLGLKLEKISSAAEQWRDNLEEIRIPERIDWIENHCDDLDNLSMEDLSEWVRQAPKKEIIDDETNFCDPEILRNVLSSKSAFDELDGNDMRRARTRSNPFETIRGSIFQNRAAVKMANIDSLCDFMFTNPKDKNDKSLVKDNDLLYFADICAGPGGFTEYVLYKKGWQAKGFGFTLRGQNDFKLDNFFAASPETFDPFYGTAGDGDIFNPANQTSFAEYVLKGTEQAGVHFVMADGGFSVDGKENIQEILSKQLYMCQCLVALSILRDKGHFVCKLFDLFTPFSVGLVYLMYKCFEEISICKPNTSRPANSERYLICKWKKSNTETVRRHLSSINQDMWDNPNAETDVRELVSLDVLFRDKEFVEYITESNNRLGHNQIVGLIKIAAYCNNPDLKEPRQAEYRSKCLELWNLPDKMRQAPEMKTPDVLLAELLSDWNGDKDFMSVPANRLDSKKTLSQKIIHPPDWYFVPLSRSEDNARDTATFFLSRGRGIILKWSTTGRWEPCDCVLEMSPKTLIYGEIVQEQIGEGSKGIMVRALHIIDGICLGGLNIARMPIKERLKLCDKFARSLNKPNKKATSADGNHVQMTPIRCKKLIPLSEFNNFFQQMRPYKMKNNSNERLGIRIRSGDDTAERFYIVGGMMFLNELMHPFVSAISSTHNTIYYYNLDTKQSFFPNHMLRVFSSFKNCFIHRQLWKWTNVYQVHEVMPKDMREDGTLFRMDFCEFLQERLKR